MLVRHLALVALALSTGVTIASQSNVPAPHDSEHTNDAGDPHVTLAASRIVIGPEYLPRRTDLPNNLMVPAGQVVELPENATYDYIEVSGTLKVSRAHDTLARVTHLVVLRGGKLDIGTQADPIPCDRRVELVVRDVPIDAAIDPYQWGNGLVNFGSQTRVGCAKSAWVESEGSIPAGATAINLASEPTGWRVGDELLIPDTAAPSRSAKVPRREAKVAIAAIDGARLTLSKPLDFAHENITDPNGVVVLRPRIVNLTRNIVIRSENNEGTRGHTADVGPGASWDIRYNQLIGLGRTSRQPLDDTVVGTHQGLNQRGRYSEHHHHVQSAVGSADVGNVYVGYRTGKWGLVLHDTSDTLIENNVAIDFPGAGFVTEDGYEVRNLFRRNFAAYNLAGQLDGRPTDPDTQSNVAHNCPGCEGSGFWLRGVMNTFEGNEAWNNHTAGFNLFNQFQPPGKYPSVPGGTPDTGLKHLTDKPLMMRDSVSAANVGSGVEIWSVGTFPNENFTAAYNTAGVFPSNSDGVALHLRNPKVICSPGSGAIGVHSSSGYVGAFQVEGGQIAGCAEGIVGRGSKAGMIITGTVLQNEVNIDSLPLRARFENVMHVPLQNHPPRYIIFGDGAVWSGRGSLPPVADSLWFQQRGSPWVVKNWQGTGKDYLLFDRQSLAQNPAWPSTVWPHSFNTPVAGLTMKESWEKFGISFGGDVLEESEAVALEGLVNGLAREGLKAKLGPPRAIVTFPTMRERAIVDGGVIRIAALLTGDPEAASSVMMASIDGGPPQAFDSKNGSDDRSFATDRVADGIHEIKVWRTKKGNPTAPLPGSEYISQYCVGPCPTVPQSHLNLSERTLTFSSGAASLLSVKVSNDGVSESNWVTRTDQSWCSVNPYGAKLWPGDSTKLTVSVLSPPKAGAATCTVRLIDHNADNSPQTITVNYSAAESGAR